MKISRTPSYQTLTKFVENLQASQSSPFMAYNI
jgi:hypothetical protein